MYLIYLGIGCKNIPNNTFSNLSVSAVYWPIWLSRTSDIVFYKKRIHSYMHVRFTATYWSHFWSQLQKESVQRQWSVLAIILETSVIEILVNMGGCFLIDLIQALFGRALPEKSEPFRKSHDFFKTALSPPFFSKNNWRWLLLLNRLV